MMVKHAQVGVGCYVEPNMPHIRGIENVPVVIHSSDFKLENNLELTKLSSLLAAAKLVRMWLT